MNRFIKLKLVAILVASLLNISSTNAVFAQDLTVNCTNTGCDMLPFSGATMFSQSNWLPGDTISQYITVNNSSNNGICSLSMDLTDLIDSETVPNTFASQLNTAILRLPSTIVYGNLSSSTRADTTKNLQVAYDETVGTASSEIIDLRTIGPGASRVFQWTVTFNPDAGNEYNSANVGHTVSTEFDFAVNFSCDDPVDDDDDDGDSNDDDDDDDDGDSNDDDDNDGDNNDNDEDTNTTTTTTVTRFFSNILGQVAGESTESTVSAKKIPAVVKKITQKPEIKGVSVCSDPWWWVLVFVVEMFVSAVAHKLLNKDNVKNFKRNLFAQLVNTVLFAVIFYVYFCPWWDVVVAIIIGLIGLYLIKRKKDKLENTGVSSSNNKNVSEMYKKIS